MKLNITELNHHTTVEITGTVDTETAPELNSALLRLDYSDLDLTLDFQHTDYITSAGLRVLLVARKKLSDETMRIINVNPAIAEVFEMTGFADMLNFSLKQDPVLDTKLSFKALLQKKNPDKAAFFFRDREYTWGDVDRASQIIAMDLSKAGVKKGSHVGICSPNSINWIFTFFAIQKIGAIAVLVNYNLKPAEIDMLAEIGSISILCYAATPGYTEFEQIAQALSGSKNITHMVNIGPEIDFTARYPEYEAIKDEFPELYHADDPSVIIFTSGSTGRPKAVLSSSYNLLSSVEVISRQCHFTSSDVNCAFLPMFHVFGFASCISFGLLYDCISYIPSSNRPDALLKLISEKRCTVFNTVPTMMLAMIQLPGFTPEALSSLRVSALGGAATSEAQMQMLRNLLPNDHFLNLYGMSENAVISMTGYEDSIEHQTQTVGMPVEDLEIEIRNPATGEKLPEGGSGEIYIRSKAMIVCYYHLAIDKQPLDDEGWLATGDLGLILPDGYLKLTGRAKDLIIRGGENISPGEVANAVAELPGVADVKVFGVPHEVYGEEVAAAIILKEGASFEEAEARKLLTEKLAKYKIPAYFVIVDKFPLLGSGKIDAISLKKHVLEMLGK